MRLLVCLLHSVPTIPEDKIAEVRSRADIVRVIGRSVNLKKAGRNWKGLCPFHSEKTPSFNVQPDKQIFHCFGCGAGGDVFRFVMDHEGRTFPEAVRMLAAEVGVDLPERDEPEDPEVRARRAARKAVVAANAAAAEVFAGWLRDRGAGAPGRDHLVARGVTGEVARDFGLGYAPIRNDLRSRLVQRGVEDRTLELSGLVIRGDRGPYERFRGRLMIPIRTADGHPIAFGARLVEGDHPAKYLNSPESPAYRKSEVLFGLDQAREHIRRENAAIVVEGYFDVIALHQAGVKNAVATCGTALTEAHCRLLSRHAKDLYLVFDGDAAGQEAAARAHDVVASVPSLVARVVRLPGEDDPDTFVRAHGPEGFQALCEKSVPVTEFLLDRALDGVGGAVEDRVRAVEAVRPILSRVRDPLARRLYLDRVAERLRVDERTLVAYLKDPASVRGPETGGRRAPDEAPRGPLPPGAEEALVLLVLEHPALGREVAPHLDAFVHDGVRRVLTFLLEDFEARGAVDVPTAIERADDPRLAARWRAHLAGTSQVTDAPLDPPQAARWVEQNLKKIRLDDLGRREAALRRRQAESSLDPLQAAQEFQELKAERRRLTRASSPRS